jgi:tyrosine-protein phosphatase SIW14
MDLGTSLWAPLTDWKPIRDEIVKAALEVMLDTRNHPVLLVDPYAPSTALHEAQADS